jgi:hypothetical protein
LFATEGGSGLSKGAADQGDLMRIVCINIEAQDVIYIQQVAANIISSLSPGAYTLTKEAGGHVDYSLAVEVLIDSIDLLVNQKKSNCIRTKPTGVFNATYI